VDKAVRSSIWKSLRKLGILSVVVGSVFVGAAVQARGPLDNLGTVALTALPAEAQKTQGLIRAGGPFPYSKDGVVFGNREQLLPRRERGFYREYTVPTPVSRDRGARRIVCGGQRPTLPEACYYTADHYASFKRIAP
jgi:ribonuclease T1